MKLAVNGMGDQPVKHIKVDTSAQTLYLYNNQDVIRKYSISTAKNGQGELINSEKTPRGLHIVRAKIGEGCPINSVFRGRRQTGEICTPELVERYPGRDWILSRIMWLSGCEIGKNRLGDVDTMRRFIYIHGTPYETDIGSPVSHGCIRMRSDNILELFDLIDIYTHLEVCS